MASNINSDIDQPDAKDIDVTGGLDLKSDSATAAPPHTTRADNCWYITPGIVRPLPPFQTILANLAQPPLHLYNTHTRDAVEGASNGDIMLHGEFADAPGSATNGWTTPAWSHNLGQTLNTTQPVLPYAARTRQLGASASPGAQISYLTNTYDANANTPIMVTQDVAGTDGRKRYAMLCLGGASQPGGVGSRTAGVMASFGYLDDGGEIVTPNLNPSALLITGSFVYMQAINIPGSQNFVIAVTTSNVVTLYFFNYSGVQQGSAYSSGSFVAGSQPIDLFLHNNTPYCLYYDKTASGNNYSMYLWNTTTLATPTALGSTGASTAPTAPLCGISAQPLYTGALANYAAIVWSGGLSVGTLAGSTYTQTASASLTPATSVPTGGVGQATGAGVIFDAVSGVGANAIIGYTIFRLFNENITVALTTSNVSVAAQSVAVDRYCFAASGNVLTLVGTTVFRTAAGAALAGKAFATNPALAQFAGPAAAKTVVCAVRAGNKELSSAANGTVTTLYGQPTYFLIDHQARIVGRWFESAAPNGTFVGALPTSAGTGIGSPSIYNAASDMCAVRIQVPSWALIQAQFAAAANIALTGTFIAPTGTPINPVFAPAVLDLQYQAQGCHVPPVRGGAHQYVSGPLTCLHDGRLLTEANFHTAAQNPGLDASQYSGSLGGSGPFTLYWTIVWTWLDALGRKHRSAPSLAASYAYTTAGQQFPGMSVICTAPLGNKWTSGSYPTAEVYRSLSNATDANSYLIGTVAIAPLGTGVTPNVGSCAVIYDNTFTDSYTNSGGTYVVGTISAQPRLYTSINATNTANIYPATQPVQFIWQVATKGRVFGLAYVQGEARLYYSSVDSFGIPLEWNSFNYATVPGEIGEARSVEALDDKVIIFGTRGNAVMNGDGPPAANTAGIPAPGDGFSAVTPLPTPAGVLGTGGPARVPTGIMYQGPQGIQMIGRDLALTPVGAPIDVLAGRQLGLTGQLYGRAALLPSIQSVVWPNPAGAAIVFNYVTQAWSLWPLLSYAQSLVQRTNGDVWVALQPMTGTIPAASTTALGADVGILTANTFKYNSPAPTSAAMVIETPWIAVGASQAGEGWIREMNIYGDCIAPHILQIEQGFDYKDYVSPATRYTVTDPTLPYVYQLRPPTARARSVRYRITLWPATTLAAQYSTGYVSDLALFMGAKQGTARLGGGNSR